MHSHADGVANPDGDAHAFADAFANAVANAVADTGWHRRDAAANATVG